MLFKSDTLLPEGAEAAKIGAAGVLQATQKIGGSFAGVGSHDLAAGIAFLRQYHQPPSFAWLSANVVDTARARPIFPGFRLVRIGENTVAVVALTDHNAFPQPKNGFRVISWQESLPHALTAIEGKADFILLLSNYSLAENKEMARSHSSIDLILQAGHVTGNLQPFLANHALIAQTDTRGKYLGVLDINWNGHARWSENGAPLQGQATEQPFSTFSNRFIPITPATESDPEIDTLVQNILNKQEKARSR